MRWWPHNCGRVRTNRECKRSWRQRRRSSPRPSRPSTWLARPWRSSSGLNPSQVNVSPGKLADQLPPDRPEPPLETAANPLAVEQNAAIAQAQSQLKAIERTYYPQFLVQGLAAARGTGLLNDGSRLGGSERAGAYDPKLRRWAHRHLPVHGPVRDPRAGSDASRPIFGPARRKAR